MAVCGQGVSPGASWSHTHVQYQGAPRHTVNGLVQQRCGGEAPASERGCPSSAPSQPLARQLSKAAPPTSTHGVSNHQQFQAPGLARPALHSPPQSLAQMATCVCTERAIGCSKPGGIQMGSHLAVRVSAWVPGAGPRPVPGTVSIPWQAGIPSATSWECGAGARIWEDTRIRHSSAQGHEFPAH